jgi:hypothetical protein
MGLEWIANTKTLREENFAGGFSIQPIKAVESVK